MQVKRIKFWFSKLACTVTQRKYASTTKKVNPPMKHKSNFKLNCTVRTNGDEEGPFIEEYNHIAIFASVDIYLQLNWSRLLLLGLCLLCMLQTNSIFGFLNYFCLVLHFNNECAILLIKLILLYHMIRILAKVVPKSIFNNLLMNSVGPKHELDILTKCRYEFATPKQTTPPQQAPPKIQSQPRPDKKKKQKETKGGKAEGQVMKQGGEKALNFEIKTPKGTRDYYPHQMAIRRKVIDTIVEVFKKHGGVQIDTPVFQLKEVLTGKYGQDSKLIYDLEDQGGEKCSLRYDLTVPFARFMANNTNIQKIKRFHIGKVYRRDQPTVNKGRFRQFYQCDFDIAGKYDSMIPDSEVLAIMQQILQAVGVNDYLVKVNHRKILEMMIKQAGCDFAKFKTICSSIDKLDKQPWAEVQEQLIKQKGLTQQQATVLGKLTQYRGKPHELLKIIMEQQIFGKTGAQIKPIFEEMNRLFDYLEAMDRIKKVSFDLSLARGLDYYTGIIYEIVLTDKTTELGSISGGGRYDDLIGMFCQFPIPSVGGSIGIERLFTILEKQYQDKVKQNACQVLVATIRNIPVKEKLRILSLLWKSNIKAETMYVEKAKPDKQISHAFENGIPMILWIGEDQLKSGQLNLKILYKHEEVKVSLQNIGDAITPYVQQFRTDYSLGKVQLKDPKKKQQKKDEPKEQKKEENKDKKKEKKQKKEKQDDKKQEKKEEQK